MNKIKEITAASISGLSTAVKMPFKFLTSGKGTILVGTIATSPVLAFYLHKRLVLLSKDEQLFIETATEQIVINGPKIHLMPVILKDFKIKKALNLTNLEYCVVRNTLSGVHRNETGPQLLYLKPYDYIKNKEGEKTREVISLMKNEFLRLKDEATGKVRVITGEQGCIVPNPTEVPYDDISKHKLWKRKMMHLKINEYIHIMNKQTGQIRFEQGEKLVHLEAFEEFVSTHPREAINLKKNEFSKIENMKTGEVWIEKGEKLLFIKPFERIMPSPYERQQAIDLTCFEYTKILNKQTGKLRTESGEKNGKLVFLGPFDEIQGNSKNRAVEVDEETAVLIRDKSTGEQKLITEKQLFIPADNEEIVETRKLIKLANYEACIVRGKDGQDSYFFGNNEKERSFFIPPYSELVTLNWSRGRRRERRDLYITKLDLRPMFMSFEFECRTTDNVGLILEGDIFWEITDFKAMVKQTADTSGDVCNYARSQFIQAISKVKFEEFMKDFNLIAARANKKDDPFYTSRGIKIHTLEVTGYKCADESTSTVLEQIVQETTNRINRLQQQESASEVKLVEIKGQIDEEKAKCELLKIQTDNSNALAAMEGLAEAARVQTFLEDLEGKVPDLETRIKLWNTLRKRDALEQISKGDARLFFTPSDVELKIGTSD